GLRGGRGRGPIQGGWGAESGRREGKIREAEERESVARGDITRRRRRRIGKQKRANWWRAGTSQEGGGGWKARPQRSVRWRERGQRRGRDSETGRLRGTIIVLGSFLFSESCLLSRARCGTTAGSLRSSREFEYRRVAALRGIIHFFGGVLRYKTRQVGVRSESQGRTAVRRKLHRGTVGEKKRRTPVFGLAVGQRSISPGVALGVRSVSPRFEALCAAPPRRGVGNPLSLGLSVPAPDSVSRGVAVRPPSLPRQSPHHLLLLLPLHPSSSRRAPGQVSKCRRPCSCCRRDPAACWGGGLSRVVRNSITIKMVLGIVLFFAGMSSLYVNHRLGLSLAGVGLVLVFVPAEFLFGLCIDFKGHKEHGRCSRSGSTKSDNRPPTEVVVEDDGCRSASGDNASTLPPEVVPQGGGSGDATCGSLPNGGSSPGSDSRRTSSPRCTCQAGKNSPPDASAQLHRTRSDVLRTGPGSAVDVRSDASPPADDVRKEVTPAPTCKFHRTRSAVLRAEDLPKNPPPQAVRFNVGSDADEPAAAAASGVAARTPHGGSRARTAPGQSCSTRATLVRGVSFEQSKFHRSKSAVMHRGSLSGDEATMSSPSSSAKSSPTRSPRGQVNSSPHKERPLAPAVARVQQLQQIPALRIQSCKAGSGAVSDPRVPTMAVQLYDAPFARTPISDLSNENYTRFHRIRAVQQQQQLQAAAVGATGVTARRKEATESPNLLLRTRSMTTSRSSTNLAQPQQQDGPRTTGKPNKDKSGCPSQDAKTHSSPGDASQRLAAEATTPKLRRTSSGPSRRPARTSKELAVAMPWTSLAVQTAAGVITLLCKPQRQEAESASLLPPKPAKAVVREASGVVPRIVTVSVSGDEDSSADREDNASPSGQRGSSSSLAQTSS
ncbi:hypothetical protein MRX96_031955, partial [Rhipicephalus microplus]